ncbi:hypothetical protein SAMN05877962_12441 [Alloalcanivorax xenomutans]|uniref:hypothetical protein n=1 Tax=Alloalcanivorax xenomutans TaxID=1094342 RepID=UPI000BD558DC|nr:hypothetical protein [Alloalcanivorax xenomutans]SOC25563.1 hypothetical protein SAMN05877962_12441 [Alloalcanivorax xenomutans]
MGLWWRPGKVVLRESRDQSGYRYLAAEFQDNGDLVFVGQDLGAGVNEAFGCLEYEWLWTIKAVDVPKLRAALQSRRPVLAALKRRFSGEEAMRLYAFLSASGVPFETYSRIGD